MEFRSILEHCVIVKVTDCKNKGYWYANSIGDQFIAFAIDEDEEQIYVCHKTNRSDTVCTIPVEHCEFVQGDIEDLWEMV